MKLHIVLQALSSTQAQTDNLRIYAQIVITEQGKLRMWRFYHLRNSNKEKIFVSITYFYLSESGGISR